MNGFDTTNGTSEEKKSDIRIGRILVAKGIISDEHLSDALELQRNKKARLGEILVFIGACKDEDVESAVQLQQRLFF